MLKMITKSLICKGLYQRSDINDDIANDKNNIKEDDTDNIYDM